MSCSPALRPMTLGSTLTASAGTVTTVSGPKLSRATIAVVSLVVLASGMRRCDLRSKSTWRLSTSTISADRARLGGAPTAG